VTTAGDSGTTANLHDFLQNTEIYTHAMPTSAVYWVTIPVAALCTVVTGVTIPVLQVFRNSQFSTDTDTSISADISSIGIELFGGRRDRCRIVYSR